MNTKHDIIEAIRQFVNTRPGFELCNYSSWSQYQSDYRPVLQAKHDFNQIANWAENSQFVTAEDILEASEHAFSGRLSIKHNPETRQTQIEYCTGQYYPTEYRNAACAVMASAIWNAYRDKESTGDSLRRQFRNIFGSRIQKHWFN